MLPLQGIRVIEIAQNLAGPYCGEILGTMGADVIKIERPEGDDARGWGPPFHDGMATSFQAVNRNKRSVALDLKDPRAIDWLHTQLASADILVQNLRPGAMEALGLDAASLRAKYPRLIYCSLWAFGASGPMKMHPGYEPIIQAFSGIFSINGTPDGPGARTGMQVLDLGTGIWGSVGCLAAVIQRATTGQGCVVDASLFETALGWLSVHLAGFNKTGVQPERHRSGNPKVVVFQAFDTADGEIVIAAANDRLFAKFAAELGHPEWGSDDRFRTNAARVAHKPILLPAIQAVLSQHGTAEWVRRLEAIGIPCSAINDLAGVMAEPQTQALGIVQPSPGDTLPLVGLPVSFDGKRPGTRQNPPQLGAHNEELGGPVPQVRKR